MQSFLALQDVVKRLHAYSDQSIPDDAVNILLSVGLKPGVTTVELISKLDLSPGQIRSGLDLLTAPAGTGSGCLGLLYVDEKNAVFPTVQGHSLIGDLRRLPGGGSSDDVVNKAYFTKEYGEEIYVLNFAHDDTAEVMTLIEECARQVRQRPMRSVLTLTLVSRGPFNNEVVESLKELTAGNSPYVRKAAVVGIHGLYKVVMNAVSRFSQRDFMLCETKEQALHYLLQG